MNNKLKLLIVGFLSVYQAFSQTQLSCDVLVYGGTAAGVMASIAAAGEGASVLLVEPGSHLGGMLTGGLSHTDYGDRAVVGGLALEFYRRVADHYQKPLYFWRGPEPHVGEQILKKWLEDSRVRVIYNERLKSVRKSGKMIGSVEMLSGRTFRAGVLIDATYEGDLMDRAGVSWTVGRESVSEYHESWAGRQPLYSMRHNFGVGISPFADEKNEKLLPLIHHKPMVKEGEADSAVQAYCFRLIMTNDPANRVTIERPENYDPARYELLRRYLKKLRPADLNGTGVIQPFINLPGNKAEINSSGPISTNLYDGSNWAYPDADYPLRDRIWADHLAYTHGLLYFIGNDPSVPEKIRRQAQEWGLCKDEFADTGHWPHQLYVREARRMLGEYVLTQHDLQTNTLKYDAIGMGSYNMDIRHVQRTWIWASHFPELFPETSNEGYISIPVKPYEIPYRSLLPRYEECANLIVPVCISSSHLAFASVRMEPQFMILGQAAGVAAAMAVRQKLPVHRIDVASLQEKLTGQGQIISLEDNPNGFFQQGNTVVVDDDMSRFVKRTGSWHASENPNVARKDITYRLTDSKEYAEMTYQPYLPASGKYRIYGWWARQATSATKAPVEITCGKDSRTVFVNQRETGDGWVLLGTFDCEKGCQTRVTISNRGADGIVIADAFKFTRVVPAQQIPPSAYLSEQSVSRLNEACPDPDPEGYELRDLFLNEVVAHGPVNVKAFGQKAAEVFKKESAQVERIMRNQVSLLSGYDPQDVGSPVDWFCAPKGDLQWPTHLSRHYWLKPLAHAWRATKDPVYSKKIMDVLLDWIEHNRIGRDKLTWWGSGDWKISNHPDSIREGFFPGYADGPWTSLSAHVRLDAWTYLLAMIHDSPQMTNRNLSVIFNSMAGDHRNMMLGHPRQMNQFISIASSLVHFWWHYPFLKGSEEVEKEGLERIRRYAESEIYPDGSMAECSPNYSKGSLNRVFQMVREDQDRGGQLYKTLNDNICRALRYFAFSADPGGYPPRMAKGGKSSVYPLIEKLGPGCGDEQVQYVYSKGKEGRKPDFLSMAWNWAGHIIFRSDWSEDATWLFFEPGPRGSGHAHPATLNIQLQTKGEWLLTDPGYYTYSNAGEDGRMTKYLGSSAAHNVALVDGENQISYGPGKSLAVNKHPGNYHWSDEGNVAKAEGIYDFGYGKDGKIKVTHKREIIYDRTKDRFVIRDTFTGDGDHVIDLHWQLPPGAVFKKGDRGFRIENGKAKVRFNIACDQPFRVESAIGSKDPLSGWFSDTYGKLEPAYTIKVSAEGRLPLIFNTEIRLK